MSGHGRIGMVRALPLMCLLLGAGPRSLAGADPGPVVQATTLWSATGVAPGGGITLGVILEIRPPYHVSSDEARPPFIPTSVDIVNPPDGLRPGSPIFP